MSKLVEVSENLAEVRMMQEHQARAIRDLMNEISATRVLELGTWRGKSTCYLAAILEDAGRDGHVISIDMLPAKTNPSPEDNLRLVGLEHRATIIYAKRSFTWELARMLKSDNPPQFDFCYLDGGHTWDVTGFGFLLVDMLLRPGGIIVLDDLDWTIERHMKRNPAALSKYKHYDDDEIRTPGVRLVWDIIVPRLSYERHEITALRWGVARKPAK